MKYLKLFEQIYEYKPIPTPNINDWVFAYNIDLSTDYIEYEEIQKYMKTHIGKVTKINSNNNKYKEIFVKYYDVPDDVLEFFFDIEPNSSDINNKTVVFKLIQDEVTYWSDNKKEIKQKMEVMLASDKYNL